MSHYNSRRGHWQDRSHERNYSFGRRSQGNNRNQMPTLTEEERKLVYQGRDELFDKKKSFSSILHLKDKSLLLSENLFNTDRWEISQLMVLKKRLNDTRDRLNEKDIQVWKQHTSKTNMTGRVVWSLRDRNDVEMCTNAWIKMAEIFAKYKNLIPNLSNGQPFRTAHVCEAPGAFICATHFYYQQKFNRNDSRSFQSPWEWTGLSLNPYYEGNDQAAMVDDDRFIIETLDNWYFGADNSGNILNINNIRGLWQRARANSNPSGAHLVTGDGSVDTSGDPNEQESIVSELHYTEAVCAMGALAKTGSLVLKMFNLFECETICLLYILAIYFDELSIFKPASSRAPNGETYIVALGFRGIDQDILNSLLSFVSPKFPDGKALIPLKTIPQSFLDELIKIAEYFTMKQVQALERNLDLEKIWNRTVQESIFQLNLDVVKEFRRQCFIDYNHRQVARIVNNVWLDGSAKALGNSAAVVKGGLRQRSGGTLQDRKKKKLDHEEFLLKNSAHDDDDIDANDGADGSVNRSTLDQGKPVLFGRNAPTTDTDIDINSSSNPQETSTSESIAMKMMKKSGFIDGQGLGVHGQGRTAPIEVVMLDTRHGLGHHNQPMITSSLSLNQPKVADEPLFSSYDQPTSAPSVHPPERLLTKTLGSNPKSVLTSIFVKFEQLEALYKKREEYDKKLNGDSTNTPRIFISDQLEIFQKDEQYRNQHGIFFSRTAYHLASLDKIFKLTSINLNAGSPLLFIVDNISLAGFAEYLVWQQQNNINGLLVSHSKVPFPMSSSVITKPYIDADHPKVHLLLSDVCILPPSIKMNRRHTEENTKRPLILACRRALTRVVEGGHFVCKINDTLTRFTAGLIYLLYRSFKNICILRPFTLDPASPERFLICRELKYPVDVSIIQHLDHFMTNEKMEDVLEVVPLKCLIEPQFQQYMADVNQRLLQREIQALTKRLWYMNFGGATQVCCTDDDWNEARECITNPRRPRPPIVEPDSGITLPPDWRKEWSNKQQQHYYFNIVTGESRWEPPN